MTKKKPSPQNRIWEKERRERLNKTFEDLQRLLPDNEPTSTLSKIEILQRAIELIGKLQKKIKDLTEECNDPLKEHVREQEDRLQKLLTRNEELIGLLKKAKVTIPPCKYTVEHTAEHIEEKENGTPEKKRAASKPQQRRSGSGSPRKQSVIKKPVAVVPPTSGVVSPSLALSNIQSATVPSSGGTSVASTSSSIQSTSPTGMNCSALRHLNGLALGTGNGVSVTPALLPTPIMTTSVLISNNGNLVQMPIVAPPSSLLIVGNEDVRAKLNLKKRSHGGGGGKGRAKIGKFTIKSIDLIPGRIVNGKVPIPPLRRAPHEAMRTACKVLKRKRKKSTEKCKKLRKTVTEEPVSKGSMPDRSFEEAEKTHSNSGAPDVQPCSNPVVAEQSQPSNTPEQPALSVPEPATTEEAPEIPLKDSNHSNVDPQEAELDLTTLNHADLSEDIFATLQVPSNPDAHGSHDAGSLSPTAAYLMNFPLVAGGGKAAGNHTEQTDEVDEACNEGLTKEHGPAHKDTTSGIPDTGTGTLMLDNFSSLFNYTQVDAATTGTVEPLPSTTTTSISQTTKDQSSFTTNYSNMYQSIDTMLEHRTVDPNRTVGLKVGQNDMEQDSNPTGAFTFTLTSSTTTAPLTTHQRCSASNQHHFYTPSVGTTSSTLRGDKKSSPPRKSPSPLAIEFTFSLTTTKATQPRTVQSQYTNSAILSSTMTTPSYDTYGYYHTTVNNKSGSYGGNESFKVPLDPLPGTICTTTEKPATSFTFCLTSSTKTQPSYAQSFTASVASTTSMFESPPKLSTKQQTAQGKDCASVGLTKHQPFSVPSRPAKDASGQSRLTEAMATHQQHAMQQQQQQPTQSKYDVSWMAAGAHDCKTGDQPVVTQSFHHQQQTGLPYQQQQQQQQHLHQQHQQPEQQLSYDFTPQIFSSAMDFSAAAGGYTANFEPHQHHHQRKSDIFFAHPPGEENGLGATGSWSSANKLTNGVLNDSSTPYFPSVTVLPPLIGESEPNASASVSSRAVQGGGKTTSGKKRHTTTHQETTATSVSATGSSFLSVSQLVDQPTKTTYHHHHTTSSVGGVPAGIPSSSVPCQQKPNSYSAEALIGNTACTVPSTTGPAESHGRREKLFDYGAGGEMATGANSSLTFNFDTYGATGPDYGKSYNFPNQFVESSTNYGGLPSPARRSSGTSTGSGLYYGKAATGTTQSYYHHTGHSEGSGGTSTYHHLPPTSTGAEFTPYYLPAFAEKTNGPAHGPTAEKQYPGAHGEQGSCRNSSKKSQKAVGILPVADYAFSTAPSDVTSGGPVVNGSQGQSLPYANYHYHQQQPPELQQQQHHHHDHHQQHQRLQHQHYGTIDGSNVPHKSSLQSGTSYNYGQYPSTPAPIGFDAPKPAKVPMQLSSSTLHLPGDDGTGLHPPGPASSYATTVSHAPHLEIAPPCFNAPPPPTVGYGVNPSSSQVSLYGGHGQVVQASGTHSSATGGTITDFNLSTICPEIDEKTGRTATVAGRNGAQVASIMSLW